MNKGSLTSDEWYWSKQGSDERNGPVSDEELKELAKEGSLEPEDLVWTRGMDDWKEAGSIKGLDVIPSPSRRVRRRHSGGSFSVASPKRKTEVGDEYSFPVEFEVKWMGSVFNNEATLRLHKDGVHLFTNVGEEESGSGGYVNYEHLNIEDIEGSNIKIEAPNHFKKKYDNKTYEIELSNHKEAKEALKIIKNIKEYAGLIRKYGSGIHYTVGESFIFQVEKIDAGKTSKTEKSEEENWYWIKQGADERNGPVTLERLKELAQEKDLKPEDLVWGSGMSGWTEASSVGKLESSFASPPSFPDDVPSPPIPDDTGDTKDNGDIGYEYKVESVTGIISAKSTINDYAEVGWILDNFSVDKREGLADVDWFYIVMRREK